MRLYDRINLPTGEFWKEYFVTIELSHDGPLWALKNYGFCWLLGFLATANLKIGSQVILCWGNESVTAYVRALQPQTNGQQGLVCSFYRNLFLFQDIKPIIQGVGFSFLK